MVEAGEIVLVDKIPHTLHEGLFVVRVVSVWAIPNGMEDGPYDFEGSVIFVDRDESDEDAEGDWGFYFADILTCKQDII
jgi:ribosomal 30S subunit maturation factor RimM